MILRVLRPLRAAALSLALATTGAAAQGLEQARAGPSAAAPAATWSRPAHRGAPGIPYEAERVFQRAVISTVGVGLGMWAGTRLDPVLFPCENSSCIRIGGPLLFSALGGALGAAVVRAPAWLRCGSFATRFPSALAGAVVGGAVGATGLVAGELGFVSVAIGEVVGATAMASTCEARRLLAPPAADPDW